MSEVDYKLQNKIQSKQAQFGNMKNQGFNIINHDLKPTAEGQTLQERERYRQVKTQARSKYIYDQSNAHYDILNGNSRDPYESAQQQ
mmetsp:Transcript_1049/g.1934  ORF Transcript_1049/g.1934 Transcript_1049/m.1934 type:complete len:87 (+) Transcript_1049:392-652(+)